LYTFNSRKRGGYVTAAVCLFVEEGEGDGKEMEREIGRERERESGRSSVA